MTSTRLVICSVIFSLLFIEGVLSRDPRRGAGGSTTLGGDVFLQGKYLEIGVNPAGSFGSRLPPGAYAWGGNRIYFELSVTMKELPPLVDTILLSVPELVSLSIGIRTVGPSEIHHNLVISF